jgi:ankyrin repeat protein
MTILHTAVRYEPPLAIVAKMINVCPELLSAKDCLGRTPLHVAAGLKVSPLLIKLIAHAYPAACYTVDEDGKTPLHLACDSSCELFEEDGEDNPTPLMPPNHNSIQALLSESPKAVTIEDFDEINPIEYAIMSNASLKTVKLLQFSSSMCLQRGYYSEPNENERPTMNWLTRDQPRAQQKALKRRRITIG